MRTAPLQGSNSETIRRDNLSAVLREVHVRGPRTRSELVAHTGLNRSTVAGIIAELSDRRLVYEEPGDRLGMPGRPSPLVKVVPDGAVVLGIEIAVHSLAVAIVGLGGVVHDRTRVAVPHGRPTLEETLERMHDLSGRSSSARPRAIASSVSAWRRSARSAARTASSTSRPTSTGRRCRWRSSSGGAWSSTYRSSSATRPTSARVPSTCAAPASGSTT